MNRYLIIKLTETQGEIPKSKENLLERSRGAWPINNMNLLKHLETMVVLHKQKIMSVYAINGFEKVVEEHKGKKNRTLFNINEIETDLVGKQVKYVTANVASTMDKEKFKNILK